MNNSELQYTKVLNAACERGIMHFRTLHGLTKFCRQMGCTTCGTYYQLTTFEKLVKDGHIPNCGKFTLKNIEECISFYLNYKER